jgi:two-component system OmpR family sensor kinase
VINAKKSVLLKSHNAPEVAFDVPLARGLYENNNRFFCVEANESGSLYVVIAESTGHRISTIKDALIFLTLPLIVLIPFTGLLVWWSIRKAQASIASLGTELARRNSYDLHPIDTNILPKELVDLGKSINNLLKRLNLALESERNFAANSAHELRTPIASAMAQMDVLMLDLKDESLQRALDAKDKLKSLENMTVKLLQLAKAESGVALKLIQVDLVHLSNLILRDFKSCSANEVNFITETHEVWVKGDIDAVGIVIQNLLENAFKYATPGSTIQYRLNAGGTMIIQNDCVAVTDNKVEHILQRFVRADDTKAGTGIGLAVVQTIVEQLQGEILVKSPCMENNRGFSVTVCLKT